MIPEAAVEVVRARHGLPPMRRASGGSHFVFLSDEYVVKIFLAFAPADYEAEVAGLNLAQGRLPIATPELIATGEVEGSRYVVVSRLPGDELCPVWPSLDDETKRRLVAQAGELCRALHAIEVPEGIDLLDGYEYLRQQPIRALDKHREDGLDEGWLTEIAELLPKLPSVETWPHSRAFLHCDIHPEHLMISASGDLTGLFDFGDAMVGPPEYDLAATAVLMATHVRGGPQVLYRAYGFDKVDDALADRLSAALILQRYCRLPDFVPLIPEPLRPGTLQELLDMISTRPATPPAGTGR